jgi:cytochrome P450
MCVARMTARLFLGRPACRDLDWLSLSINFSIDFFACAFVIRKIPKWLHPILAPMLPLRWRVAEALRTSTAIVGPLAKRHLAVMERRAAGEKVEEEDTLLNWMIDNCTEVQNSVEDHAAQQAMLTLASIHTTSAAVANLLFDICAHPEWFAVLREEIEEIEQDLGKFGERPGIGTAQWLPRLEKLDSAMAESLRRSPPLLRAYLRIKIRWY